MTIDRNQLIETHQVFKRSFLKEAGLSVSFPEIGPEQMNSKIKEFLKFAFKIDPATVSDSVEEGVEISAPGSGMKFQFEKAFSELTVPGKDYRSFKESLLKFARPVDEYVKMVAETDSLTSLSVTKVNYWRLRAENPSRLIQDGMEFIFRKQRLAEMPKIEFPIKEGEPRSISIESNPVIPGVSHKLKLILEVSSSEDSFIEYKLTSKASSEGEVALKNFVRTSFELNSFLYMVFIDLVSDRILELMDNEQ